MNTPVNANINQLEEKYKNIRERRLALEAEFSRIEKEYHHILTEIARLKDTAQVQNIHQKIQEI